MNYSTDHCVRYVLTAILVGVVLVCGSHAAGLEEEKYEKTMPTSKPAFPGSQQVPAAKPPLPSDRITMNFDDADLGDLIKFISDLTGKNFIVDDKVKGKVTIFSPTPITVEEAYQVFLSVLEMKGFTVVESGRITKIVPSKDARYRDIPTIKEEDSKRRLQGDRIITQIIPLSFADANVLKGMLRPMVSKDSHIVAYTPTNTLIITDYASNIHRLMSIIRDVDIEESEDVITVIPLKHASAKTLVSELLSLVETKRPQRAVRRPQRRQPGVPKKQSAVTVTKLIADERTNSLVLVASRAESLKVRSLAEKLDMPLPPGKERIQIYYLENAAADELIQVLRQLPTEAGTPSRR